jgi:hypothetical protein
MEQTAKLACDVVSAFHVRTEVPDTSSRSGVKVIKGPKIYGTKNEEVKLIADHAGIWIVENNKGDRYPVKKELLIIDEVEIVSEEKIEEDNSTKQYSRPTRATKKDPVKASNQTNLF